MTNEDKYKTPEERTKAFYAFCDQYKTCKDCHLFTIVRRGGRSRCAFSWLAQESKEEKPLPCPFCDYPSPYLYNDGKRWLVDCGACGSQIFRATRESAIAAWNRRVK